MVKIATHQIQVLPLTVKESIETGSKLIQILIHIVAVTLGCQLLVLLACSHPQLCYR